MTDENVNEKSINLLEIKVCSHCKGEVLPGLDYTDDLNQKVGKLIEGKNKFISSMAKGRLKINDIKKTGIVREIDFRTGREVGSHGSYEINFRRDNEFLSNKLYYPFSEEPLCETCFNTLISQLTNLLNEFSPKLNLHNEKKSKIEKIVSSFNKKIADIYKRGIKK